jgi:hypothetical protein
VLAQPDTPLSEIEMLTEDEKKQQLAQDQKLLESNSLVLKTIRRKKVRVPTKIEFSSSTNYTDVINKSA